jgi:hypothetical protein
MKRYIEGGFASAFEAALHVIANAMAIWTNRFCNEKTPGLVFAMERFRDGFASGFPPDRNFSGFF